MNTNLMMVAGALAITLSATPVSAQVRVVPDVDYVAGADYADKKDRLDLYVPAGAKNAPIVISIHGGGLRAGDKSQQTFVGQRFASAGYVTAVVNHRLSPGVMHPAHIEDIAAAVAWVRQNAARHGGDPRKIFVIGHSAGAYLAALLVLDPRYLAAHRLTPQDLRGVVPVSAFFYVDRPGVAPDRPKDTWGTEVSTWRDASPAKYVRAGLPPLLLLYADGDDEWRRQQQDDFAGALRQTGDRQVQTRMITGRDHNTVWNKMREADDATSRAIVEFIEQVLATDSR